MPTTPTKTTKSGRKSAEQRAAEDAAAQLEAAQEVMRAAQAAMEAARKAEAEAKAKAKREAEVKAKRDEEEGGGGAADGAREVSVPADRGRSGTDVLQHPLHELQGIRSGVSVVHRHVPGFFVRPLPGVQEVLPGGGPREGGPVAEEAEGCRCRRRRRRR